MTIYHLRDGNPLWTQAIEKMIGRLSHLAIDKGDHCYLPNGGFEPEAKIGPGAEMPVGIESVEHGNGRLIQGLAQYYKVSGYEPARKFAAKLANYLRYHGQYYDERGQFLMSPMERRWMRPNFDVEGERYGGHFHAHTIGLLSLLEYAAAVGDRNLLEFIK